MSQKTATIEPYSRGQSRSVQFLRDSALIGYLLLNFTAIPLLFLPKDPTISQVAPEGSLFWQITILLFVGIGIFLQVINKIPTSRFIIVAAPIIPIMIWIVISTTWSDVPYYSVRRAFRLLFETSGILLFAAAYHNQYSVLRTLYLVCGLVILGDLIFLGMPDISFEPSGYAGVHYAKNVAGPFCLLAFPIFLLAIIDRNIFPWRIFSILLTVSCLLILVLTKSKSAIGLVLPCTLLTLGFISLRRARPVTALITILIIILASSLAYVIVRLMGENNFLTNTVGDDTFTGRSYIWDYALSLFWQSPIVGHGYNSIWRVGPLALQKVPGVFFLIAAGHSGYIDTLAELGIVGLILTIVFLLITFYRMWVRIPYASVNRLNFVAIYLTFAVFTENFVESISFRSGNEFWSYYLLVIFSLVFIRPLHPGGALLVRPQPVWRRPTGSSLRRPIADIPP